jgi:hypothetical protein
LALVLDAAEHQGCSTCNCLHGGPCFMLLIDALRASVAPWA